MDIPNLANDRWRPVCLTPASHASRGLVYFSARPSSSPETAKTPNRAGSNNEHVLDEHVRYWYPMAMRPRDDKLAISTNRRERPSKPALTRDGIIETALKILRTEGLGKVTMRRVAAALDTGPASLYVYVRDTEDFHAQILDALLAPVSRSKPDGDWRKQIKGVLHKYMEVLFAYPALARMAMSTPASGPNYMRMVDKLLGFLAAGNVPDQNAAWGVDLLLLYATANAAEHGTWKESRQAADDFVTLKTAVTEADPKKYPHIARLKRELLHRKRDRLEWSLDVLINGVLETLISSRENET